ncbi:MAG: RagB/SusD family nutrient uptake outer membrane protein, partial [Chitinophagaceae bacterium]|nr:RagB/SusD family nutrient uptake outer membrane protein [Chitinophagaceae bacterium]
MKNRIYTIGILFFFLLAACQKLDREITTDLNKELIESVQGNVGSLLNGVYGELREGFLDVDGAMIASATDEAEHADEGSSVQNFN